MHPSRTTTSSRDMMRAALHATESRAIARRAFLLAGACVATREASAALPVPPGDRLAFRLMRHGGEIGRHTLTFERKGETLIVRVAVDALVTLLSLPIVRYSHRVTETWRGEMLQSVTGETIKNGQHEWVDARRGAEGLVVIGSKTARYISTEPAGVTSYWNKTLLNGPMISLEDGVLLRPKVEALGPETISLASGAAIAADHFNLSGPFAADLWYDHTATWASMAVGVADGSVVHYERL
jgi:hypothetical protein